MSQYGHQSSGKPAKKPLRQVVREQWMAAFALVGVAIVGCYLPSTLERLSALESAQQQVQPVEQDGGEVSKRAGHAHVNGVVDVVHHIEQGLAVSDDTQAEASAGSEPVPAGLNQKTRVGNGVHDFRPKCCCGGRHDHDGHKPVHERGQGHVASVKHVAP